MSPAPPLTARVRRLFAEAAEGVRIAGGALAANRLRTFLTTLGIVIGVMTVIAIVAIIQGLNKSFEAQVANLGTNTVYVDKWKWLSLDEDWWKMRNRKPIRKKELDAVARDSTVAVAVAPMLGAMSTASVGDRTVENVIVRATNEQFLASGGGTVQAGRFLAQSDVDLARTVVVIGADVLDQLFPARKPESVLGERLRLSGRHYTIIGVMERRGRFLGMSQDNIVITPYTSFQSEWGSRRGMTLAVTAPPGKLPELEDELTAILRRVRQVPPGAEDDFSINRQDQFLRVYDKLTGALYMVAVGVGLITLLVGGIGIMNIMLVSVHERTREIGVRRALGARRATILAQFLIEASAVSAAGGAIGTAFGLGAAALVARLSPLAAAVTPSAVALGLGFSAVVGLAFGAWPAWRAAHLDPVECLRYE